MTQPERSNIHEVDCLLVDVRARVMLNGLVWAEGWASNQLLQKGSRTPVRMTRSDSTYPGELVVVEIDLEADAEEVQRLRARVAQLEASQ